jgi:hypothetical protein
MKQISVVAENTPGIMADISSALSDAHINIESISVDTIGKMGLIKMMISDYGHALQVLNDEGYNAVTEEILLVKLVDRPGELAGVARKFKDASINIVSLRLIERDGEFSIAAISCDNTDSAKKLLADRLVS